MIQLPPGYKDDDSADTAFPAICQHEEFDLATESYGNNKTLAMQHFLQGYLAAIASMDEQVGVVMEALNNTALKDNTIVVFTSDHGFQIGEKDSFGKDAPWQKSLGVPLVIRAPGVTTKGTKPMHAVTTLNIYPTLKDLCGIKNWTNTTASGNLLEGFSLKPFLKTPSSHAWNGPSYAISEVMVYTDGQDKRKHPLDPYSYHLSIIKDDMHYIRVEGGGEELYDLSSDPYEWINIVNNSYPSSKKKELKKLLTAHF